MATLGASSCVVRGLTLKGITVDGVDWLAEISNLSKLEDVQLTDERVA